MMSYVNQKLVNNPVKNRANMIDTVSERSDAKRSFYILYYKLTHPIRLARFTRSLVLH